MWGWYHCDMSTLKYGDRDPGPRGRRSGPVTSVQKALLHWRAWILPKHGADGDLGDETWNAISIYAKEHNLPQLPDGMIGSRVPVEVTEALFRIIPPKPGVERGLLIGGKVVPGTEWIRRDPDAWWAEGERGTRKRAKEVDLYLGHWTAGHPHTGESAARKVVANMKARKKKDGSPMNVGIDFVISWDGLLWQTAPWETATVHVSRGDVNARAKGVECCSPGTAANAKRLGVQLVTETVRVKVGSGYVDAIVPPKAMVATWVRLGNLLASLTGVGGLSIPRQVPDLGGRRFTLKQQRGWRGGQEHYQVPGTTKVDHAGLLLDALAEDGWARVVS